MHDENAAALDGVAGHAGLFATVEMINKTVIEVGFVGVVVSYTGGVGEDLSGDEYRHGELVRKGSRGVWNEPLLPGKYAFNTYAGKVVPVPTTNIILKWIRSESGVHRFDENLAEVSLITKDAFEPSLPLSVVMHIDYHKAPLVIQRFGDVKRLVEQTLDPMVSAYFKNIGQTRTLIQLIQERGNIQQIASEEMKERFEHYNLELEEVLIGTPVAVTDDKQFETGHAINLGEYVLFANYKKGPRCAGLEIYLSDVGATGRNRRTLECRHSPKTCSGPRQTCIRFRRIVWSRSW